MYLGDNLLEQDLGAFVHAFEAARDSADPPTAQILLKQVPDPHRFGIAELDADGHVVRLVEKPADPPQRSRARRRLPVRPDDPRRPSRSIAPSPRGELEITDAIQWLIDQGMRVRCELLDRLVDRHRQAHAAARGEPAAAREDRAAHRRQGRRGLDHRRSCRHRGRRDRDQLDAPRPGGHRRRRTHRRQLHRAVLARSATAARSINSEVEHSVIMERSTIIDIPRLEDSLIGKEAVVSRIAAAAAGPAVDDRRPLPDRRRVTNRQARRNACQP